MNDDAGSTIRVSYGPRATRTPKELKRLLRVQLDSQLSYLAVPQAIANYSNFDEWLARNVFTPAVVEIIAAGALSEGTAAKAWWVGEYENTLNAISLGWVGLDAIYSTQAIMRSKPLLETLAFKGAMKLSAAGLRKLANAIAAKAYSRLAKWLCVVSVKAAAKLSASTSAAWVPWLGWTIAIGGWIWTAHDLIGMRQEFIDAIADAIWPDEPNSGLY